MGPVSLDSAKVRNEQREIWDAVSAGWQRWQVDFERGAASVTAVLLEQSGIAPGQAVLDVGTGLGEPAISAADLVGPSGQVLGIDLSPVMIAAARTRVGGRTNIELAVGDVESMALPAESVDAVLSRWALMFFPDRVATLRALVGLLKPGGVLSAAVWGPPSEVPMISLAFSVISERLALAPPPAGSPGPFAMSNPGELEAELTAAGFTEISVREHFVPFRLNSVAEFAHFARDVLPPGMKLLLRQRCSPGEESAIWAAFARRAERYRTDGGEVAVPSMSLCVRAVAPGGAG